MGMWSAFAGAASGRRWLLSGALIVVLVLNVAAEAEATHGDSGLLLMGAGVAAGLMGLWLRWRRGRGWGD